MTSPFRRPLALALAASGMFALAACGGSGGTSTPSVSSSVPSSPSSSSSPSRPATRAVNPFTGRGPVPRNPVIAVKMDDTDAGRPQVGIDKADIVFIEAVEGGLTRLAAVFATNAPNQVGYVRSTRPSDPDLLLQFGKITEAYSGGAHDSLPRVRASGITSWSNDAGAPFYSRRPHANDHGYINLVLDVSQVAKQTKTPRAHSIGWTFSPSLSGLRTSRGTDIRTEVTGSYSHGTAVEFRWDRTLHAYVRYIDGVRQVAADGSPVTATNVIVQSCRVVSHPADRDVLGNPSQFTYTTGTGRVSVFRGGRRIDGVWSRKHLLGGTTLRTGGRAIPLAPGNTWVVLIRSGVPVRG